MTNSRIRTAHGATVLVAVLAGIASLAGLLRPELYGEVRLAPAMRGQDLLTLLALPVLVGALLGAARGSARATFVWIGLLAYVLYTYTGAAFAYRFNRLFLVYVALFALSALALGAAVTGVDARALHRRFDGSAPRRALAAYLLAIAALLGVSELGQIVPALARGSVPALIARSDGAGNFVYVLDLGVVAPLAVAAAFGLRRRAPWGDVLAGCILVKAVTMGLALLAMTWFSLRAGQPLELALTIAYGAMAACGLAMLTWFLVHARVEHALPPRRDRGAGRIATTLTAS